MLNYISFKCFFIVILNPGSSTYQGCMPNWGKNKIKYYQIHFSQPWSYSVNDSLGKKGTCYHITDFSNRHIKHSYGGSFIPNRYTNHLNIPKNSLYGYDDFCWALWRALQRWGTELGAELNLSPSLNWKHETGTIWWSEFDIMMNKRYSKSNPTKQ